MLPRSSRLHSEKEILATIRQGQRLHTPWVRLYFKAEPASPTTRIACVVGRKVAASAVVRHRYQRWLREIARLASKEIFLAQRYDMVWVALPQITSLSSQQELKDKLWAELRTLKTL